MKNITNKFFILLFLVIITAISCNDFGDINTDPNNPTAVSPNLLLGSIEFEMANISYSTFNGGNMGATWSQQLSKVQYNDEERFNPRQASVTSVWERIYARVISDSKDMEKLANDEGNNNLKGIAIVMQAYGYLMLTDLYGDIPFTEAIDPTNIQPAYDTQEDVYHGVFGMLDEANSLIGTGGAVQVTTDNIYGGDVMKWKKFANSLKFRALMRISKKEDVSARLQSLVNAGNMFTSASDDASFKYQNEDPNANPIYESVDFGNRTEWRTGKVFVDYLLTTSDPRIGSMIAENADGDYVGKPAGIADVPNTTYNVNTISGIGPQYLKGDAVGNFMTHSQLEFLIAEAITRSDITLSAGSANDHYNAGIASSFKNADTTTSGLSTFQTGLALNADEGSDLEKIAMQNYVALFCQGFESYIEQKRTGYPVLTMPQDAYINDFPVRLNYPNIESSINSANYQAAVQRQGADLLTTKMWRLQ